MKVKQHNTSSSSSHALHYLLSMFMVVLFFHGTAFTVFSADPVLVKDIHPASGSSGANPEILRIGDTLFFSADDGVHYEELWRSDGTAAGTYMVKDISLGDVSEPYLHVNYNGNAYFSAYSPSHGYELYRSDGTEDGTYLVKDINPSTNDGNPEKLVIANNILFFTASDGTWGYELYRSDGTTAGTYMVKDINTGSNSSNITYPVEMNNLLYFRATTNGVDYKLWQSDGTSGGTVVVPDGPLAHTNPRYLININNTLYFAGTDGTDVELWKYDGSFPQRVANINAAGSSYPQRLYNLNGTLFFVASDGGLGYELWKSDGTEVGTVLVKDISTGSGSSGPNWFTKKGDLLYFSATTPENGNELWVSDGTESGTMMVSDINSGSSNAYPGQLTVSSDLLFFTANDGINGQELWQTDGTAEGTLLFDINPGVGASSPGSLIDINGLLLFRANDGTHGNELMKFEGSTAPVISTIEKQFALKNEVVGPFDYTVFDSDTDVDSLVITATSSNQNILQNSGIVLNGSGNQRTITLTPVADQLGTTTVTLSISDGTNSSEYIFYAVWGPVGIGDTRYETIYDAKTAAVDGDVILVAPGTYSGVNDTTIYFSGKNITIKGEKGPLETIIDLGPENAIGFIFQNGETRSAVLDGFTIKNGYGGKYDFTSGEYRGGAIYIENSSPTIRNCVLQNNYADFGGALYSRGTSSPLISNTTFIDNIAADSGGGATILLGDATLENCLFTNNRALTGSAGAVFCNLSAQVSIDASLFKNNASYSDGGAVSVDGNFSIANSVFINNSSENFDGGAVRLDGISANGTITNSTFFNNYAEISGGAVDVWGGDLTLSNSILWGNSSGTSSVNGGSQLSLSSGAEVTVAYSDLENGLTDVTAESGAIVTDDGGNIADDPLFASSDELRLLANSPCIDTGTLLPAGGLPLYDFDSNPRSVDGDGVGLASPDMGAYEFVLAPTATITPQRINFSVMQGEGTPEIQHISIRNSGTGTLRWQVELESWDGDWLNVEPLDGFSSGETKTITLTVDNTLLASMDPGSYQAAVRLYDPDNKGALMREIPVSLVIGKTITVSEVGGSGEFNTIQEGIHAAKDGDVVLVASGTYFATNMLLESKAITVKSENGPEFTTIDCDTDSNGTGNGRAFIANTGEGNDTILQGFTMTNCYDAAEGGAVYIDASSSLTVINCIFDNNAAGSHGGALYSEGENTVIRNCEFNNNESETGSGGAVYLGGNFSAVTDCSFTSNTASDNGGAAFVDGDDILISTSSFLLNEATLFDGGAVYAAGDRNNLANCLFEENNSNDNGGAVRWGGDSSFIANSIFDTNSILTGSGSAVWLVSSTQLSNCSFYNNSGGGTSGTLYAISGSGGIPEVSNVVVWQASGTSINTPGPLHNSVTHDGATGTDTITSHPFIDPENGDFRLDPAADTAIQVIDAGYTSNWLFSDYRGSLRPINGDGLNGSEFDIGAMEYSKFYGGLGVDQVAKAFANLRIESPSVAIGYAYNVEWDNQEPFPLGDERIQQAGEFAVNLALVNNFGYRIELGSYTRATTPIGYTIPYIFEPEHIGEWRLRLEMASDPNQYLTSDPVTIEYKELSTYFYGMRISPPEGADGDLKPDFNDDGALYWSEMTKRLYAVGGPKSVVVTWYADQERTQPFPMVAFVTMPPVPQIHIAGSMAAQLLPEGSRFDSVDIKFTENDASTAGGEFTATTEGWSVLLFSDNEGETPEEQEVFEIVRTFTWNHSDPNFPNDPVFPGERSTDIGSPVIANLENGVDDHEYSCGNGYVFFDESNIDAYGVSKSYDLETREGSIFPVNLDFTGPIVDAGSERDDLVVVWYEKSPTTGACWPYKPVRYTPQWPIGADRIYIDSGLGSGPLDTATYGQLANMAIYNQPDDSLPGFNPNEEHAAFFTAQESTYPGVFPLRNDINRADTSEPYVLLKYIDPATAKWNMKAWRVLDTDTASPPAFTYDNVAGNEINAPYPLNQFVYGPCAESYTSTPTRVLKDKDNKMFSFEGDVQVGVNYFYKLQAGFYFDLDGNGLQDEPDGTCIAWLDGRDGEFNDFSVQAKYNVTWPELVPTLFVGETLIDPKTQTGESVGLPEIGNQCAVTILYDDNGVGNSARLINPVSEMKATYPTLSDPEKELPQDLLPKKDLGTGRWVFTALPYHIQSRLTYDEVSGELKLKGVFTSGVGEPYLLLNVLTEREMTVVKSFTPDAGDFETVLDTLNDKNKTEPGGSAEIIKGYTTLPYVPDPPSPTDPAVYPELNALSAGDAQGTGYITLAFNNEESCAAPTMLSVIKVDCGLYTGDVKVIESPNPFEEKVTLRHNGDFGGNADDRAFQWMYLNADFPGDPEEPLGPIDPPESAWKLYTAIDPAANPTDPAPDAAFYDGAVDTVIQGTGEQLLPDKWFSVRYYMDGVCPSSFSEWTPPQLYEGWIKRVMKKINLFDQKVTDFHTAQVSDYASMISLAGQRYEGDIALSDDPDHLQGLGIIETYETLFNRGLSLISTDSQDLNKALLFAANRLADLYMLLGNEAYGDAADPTIGFSTESGQYGSEASSIFSFQNQADSLLEEEMILLRGRDRNGVRPFYNHLTWNFTLGDGEVAYKENYNITDQDDDGDIDEYDAKIQYPQGHGDAWGYYLSAMKKYYFLLKHDLFTWNPQAEDILVAGVPVKVDYRDERKFASAAAARAKTGAEIVNLTYRAHYTEDPEGQWQGYKDSSLIDPADPDSFRAWGVDGWAKRTGQAALFDWVVGNAILPSEYLAVEHVGDGVSKIFSYDPGQDAGADLEVKVNGQLIGPEGYTINALGNVEFDNAPGIGDIISLRMIPSYGVERVDRTTVTDLLDIVGSYNSIEAEVDKANSGLNPLGLAKNSIPFDIDPQLVASGQTHFEQIYSRAVEAMNNAISVFNHANQSTQLLRRQQDTLADFQRNIENMEADYNNRLIEIYGYPYSDDCGPNETYTTDECGTSPDLYHYMYVEGSELMGEEAPKVHEFDITLNTIEVGEEAELVKKEKSVTFHVSTDSRFGIIKPDDWFGSRKAPGELQLSRGELLQARSRFERAMLEYDNLLTQIDRQAELISVQYGVNAQEIDILNKAKKDQENLNKWIYNSRERQLKMRVAAKMMPALARATMEGIPQTIGLIAGMAAGSVTDMLSAARSAILLAGEMAGEGFLYWADNKSLEELSDQQAKEIISAQMNIDLTTLHSSFAIEQQLHQLKNMILNEVTLRHEFYVLTEAMQQSANRYLAVLARGDRILKDRLRFRQQTAAQIQDYRYKDMSFRIFRNDALQKYRAQFDLAAKYVYLAAKAYDYETTLLDYNTMAGQDFFTDIVKQRTIGTIEGGLPLTGSGLADPMKRMWQNFSVLKPQLGINNPQVETNRFSLRQELFRVKMDTASNDTWRQVLDENLVTDLWDVPEFRKYCRPFAAEGIPQPGLVIPFSTSITAGLNFFKWPLGGGDSYYSSTNYATKVRSVGVWFSNYNSVGLAQTPRVYLVPVGEDVLRTPYSSVQDIRTWQVTDQKLPVPFPISDTELEGNPDWIPTVDTIFDEMFQIRKHSDFRAYHDSGTLSLAEMNYDSRLIGRSVWNSKWLLIIPGQNLLYDANEGLETFINGPEVIGGTGERTGFGISDIKLFFETYGYSGN